ncbi:uncharacterized protein METZ01_LOCUS392581, partial [marine metagenome]
GKGNSYMLGMNETWGLYVELLPTGSGTWEGLNNTYLVSNGLSPHFLSENAWSQVATTHDGQDLKVYVNGVMIHQITLSINLNQNDQSTVIGNCSSPHADRWLNGIIDETSIWNTALSQSEIQSYMTTSPTGNESGLVGYWNFNSGTGTTLVDQTANDNDGTISGATWSTDIPFYSGPSWYVSTSGSDDNDGSENNPFSTIQAGIDASSDGDTVLVAEGTYTENINYNGKNIVVGSFYLTTQDTSYISSTNIDGNQSGSVVTFVNNEDATTVLIGFTLQNGTGTDDGDRG